MKLLGLGTQIIECTKVARMLEEYEEKFLMHVFTAQEVRRCKQRKHMIEVYTSVWACKEAVFRSLGTRWRKGMNWKGVEIRHDITGDLVELHGLAKQLAGERKVEKIWLSSSHTRKYATATAVAMG